MIFVIISAFAILLFYSIFKLTIGSIEHLGIKMNTFYPFNLKVDKPNAWSTLFYLIILIILSSIVLILAGARGEVNIPGLPA